MRKHFVAFLCVSLSLASITFTTLPSCADEQAQKERDSLRSELQLQQVQIEEMNSVMSELATVIDSVSSAPNRLSIINNDGKRLSKGEMKQAMIEIGEMLSRQRAQIVLLKDSLSANSTKNAKMLSVIEFLNSEIASKEQTISELQAELAKKNVDISNLTDKVSTLNKNVEDLTTKTEIQEQALQAQDEILNECFVMIGTKKELTAAGLLKKTNIFSKKKLDMSSISSDSFSKVDIRYFTEVTIDSKKVKILSPMPEGSYQLNTRGSQTTLIITDPTKFWSISNYLIVQTN